MKKLMATVLAVTMVLTSSIGVFAAENENAEKVYNMDAETFEETRMAQIDEALEAGKITLEQAELLRAHVLEVAQAGTFASGPANGNKGDGNAECVLGDELNLGIFRSESAGMRTGSGNGIGKKSADGTGAGNGNRGTGQGTGSGQGNRGANRGSGQGKGNVEDCLINE